MLGWSVILLLLQVVAQATAASDLGPTYLFSPRDEHRESTSVIAGRLARALNNLLETYPAFVALALGLIVTARPAASARPAHGSGLWLASHMFSSTPPGIPVVRTLVWLVSIIGLVLMLIRLMA